jgi:hypothetical protein
MAGLRIRLSLRSSVVRVVFETSTTAGLMNSSNAAADAPN